MKAHRLLIPVLIALASSCGSGAPSFPTAPFVGTYVDAADSGLTGDLPLPDSDERPMRLTIASAGDLLEFSGRCGFEGFPTGPSEFSLNPKTCPVRVVGAEWGVDVSCDEATTLWRGGGTASEEGVLVTYRGRTQLQNCSDGSQHEEALFTATGFLARAP